jgi:para-aminobenzoate synthetase component II
VKTKILIIDNYDSFVYNIARYIIQLGGDCDVVRNDAITLDEIKDYDPTHIIISPGPCTPDKAGIILSLIKAVYRAIPILGICLGHQAIGQAFGGKIMRAIKPMHGEASLITHNEKGLFKGIENPVYIGRYHSLIVDETDLMTECCVVARSEEGEVMALAHQDYPIYGVQFHPESVLTTSGYQLFSNFILSSH